MVFKKSMKNKAYYSRYQTKFRRRREGKTDYFARRRLVTQDKNKYGSPKFRFVVRFTNRDIICQVIYATMDHDVCLSAAYSHELPRFGVKRGLTNYAAAYCTGLLCARRLLKKFDLENAFEGQKNVKDADYEYDFVPQETMEGRRPFKAHLDVGVKRTSSGSRLFAAVKGACDGGLNVPHSTKRFFGYNEEDKSLDGEAFRAHLLGTHVADYMRDLQENDAEAYKKQFAQYIKDGVKPDDMEKMYTDAHAAIRSNPAPAGSKYKGKPAKPYVVKREKRISRAARKERAKAKIAEALGA